MKNQNTIHELETLRRKILEDNLKREVLEQLDSLEKIINLLKGQPITSIPNLSIDTNFPASNSIQGLVVNAVVELIQKLGRQVKNEEISDYLERKQISLGETKDKRVALASILFQEVSKKNGRLKRVARGVYYIK